MASSRLAVAVVSVILGHLLSCRLFGRSQQFSDTRMLHMFLEQA